MELQKLDMSALVDMLSTHTADYTRMMNKHTSEDDYVKCQLAIKALQSEIESRKQTLANTSVSDPGISLPEYVDPQDPSVEQKENLSATPDPNDPNVSITSRLN